MELYIVFRNRGDSLYYVARVSDRARCVGGPFVYFDDAHTAAARLASPAAVYGTWPAEFGQRAADYASDLNVDDLPRDAYIVRRQRGG